jgi:ATP-dependent DNA ligase
MRAAGIAELPEPRMCRAGCAYEPKFDGWRCLAFVRADGVDLRSRAGKPLAAYFSDLGAPLTGLPVGTVLDGELIIWDTARGRTSFPALQRRITAGRALAREARTRPATLVCFDLLQDGDDVLIDEPLIRRRARLEARLADAPTALALCPQTTDPDLARRWMDELAPTGIEGLVVKDLAGRYQPGRPGWWKLKRRVSTEAIVGGVTGTLAEPSVLLLGRLDAQGSLRYIGRTGSLTVAQRHEITEAAVPVEPGAGHPWPQPLPPEWSGQLDNRQPVEYLPLKPLLVAEIVVDQAYESGRLRHHVRHLRLRPDVHTHDVPLWSPDRLTP